MILNKEADRTFSRLSYEHMALRLYLGLKDFSVLLNEVTKVHPFKYNHDKSQKSMFLKILL